MTARRIVGRVGCGGPALDDRNFALRQRQRHQRLAIGRFAKSRGVLRRDADRMRTLLRQRRVVDDEHRLRDADQAIGLEGEFFLQYSLANAKERTISATLPNFTRIGWMEIVRTRKLDDCTT